MQSRKSNLRRWRARLTTVPCLAKLFSFYPIPFIAKPLHNTTVVPLWVFQHLYQFSPPNTTRLSPTYDVVNSHQNVEGWEALKASFTLVRSMGLDQHTIYSQNPVRNTLHTYDAWQFVRVNLSFSFTSLFDFFRVYNGFYPVKPNSPISRS